MADNTRDHDRWIKNVGSPGNILSGSSNSVARIRISIISH